MEVLHCLRIFSYFVEVEFCSHVKINNLTTVDLLYKIRNNMKISRAFHAHFRVSKVATISCYLNISK